MDQETYLKVMEQQHACVCIAPTEVNKEVDKLLTVMGLDVEPEQVPVRPEEYCKLLGCYYNVAEKVKRDGGKIHYGWAIWQSHYLCQSEHHAVWEDDNENLIDITPREKPTDFIMFVPDNEVLYKEKPIARIQINTTKNPIVDHIIYGHKVLDFLALYETRIDRDRAEVPAIVMEVVGLPDNPGMLRIVLAKREEFFLFGNKPTSKCYCGSDKQYSNCHGKFYKHEMAAYVQKITDEIGEPPKTL